jgi:hypothetical protein
MTWLEPWCSVADKRDLADGLVRELQRELATDHPLFGLPVEAVGRRCDCDDVAFRLLDGSGRFAVVHLTWIRNPPDRPPFPWTTIFESCDQWIAERMLSDDKEYMELDVRSRLRLDRLRLRSND